MAVDAQLAQPLREDGLGHSGEVVECGDAVVADAFVGSYRDAGRDVPDGAGHAGDDDIVDYRNGDRMLIAQAQLEALVLLSADGSFDPYDVEVVDARQ